MKKVKKGKIELYEFDTLGKFPTVSIFVSSRHNGISKKPYASLNLAFNVGDKSANVLENRKILAGDLGVDPRDFVFIKQIHSGKVVVIKKEDRGRGAFSYKDSIDVADAMVTNSSGVFLTVQIADCVPVLIFDPERKVIAAVHAGWRGTMKQITRNTARIMQSEFGCELEKLVVGIGPSIGPCCFKSEKPELLEKWHEIYSEEDDVIKKHNGRVWIDLWQANKVQLMQLGVKEKNIEIAGVCTNCNTDEFYSYKKEGVTGRFGAGIMLNS